MKKFIYGCLFLALTGIGVIACEKTQKATPTKVYGLGTDEKINEDGGIGIKFTWKGVDDGNPSTPNPCAGSPCGACIGICIYRKPKKINSILDITPEMREDGEGIAYCSLDGQTLYMRPDRSCDNGDGYVTIIENYSFGYEVSQIFNKNEITILEGKYKIDYTSGDFGIVKFNVDTE